MNAIAPVAAAEASSWPDEGLIWISEPRKLAPGLDSLPDMGIRRRRLPHRLPDRPSGLAPYPMVATSASRDIRWTSPRLAKSPTISTARTELRACRTEATSTSPYEISRSRTQRLRIRLNATPIRTSRRTGANIVLRPIPDMPPPLAQQLVEAGIIDAFRPTEGMIIVSGATGSGKSTLIAGFTVDKLLDPNMHCNIAEGAAPIEFLLDRLKSPSSTINQTEIPQDLPTFEAFIRGCMRREPTDIIIGECRDSVTMTAAVQAAISEPRRDHHHPRQRRGVDHAADREPVPAGGTREPDQRRRAVG